MSIKHCPHCGQLMEKWGKTQAGSIRFFCPLCKKTSVWKRDDLARRRVMRELYKWLGGKENLTDIAHESGKTRQALWKEFRPLFDSIPDSEAINAKVRILIVDGTYIHSHSLCALVGVDEQDHIYWKFAPYESYTRWIEFLSDFQQPEIVVMDGQKGLFAATKRLWPEVPIQRCQFHVISFAVQFIGRRPTTEMGKELLNILYQLKDAKTPVKRDEWVHLYRMWERQYDYELSLKNAWGNYQYARLRSARLTIRKALPYLFTFLDYPGAPNTTNLVEGWVNGAIAEALRRHRGLRVHEKKALVSVILSNLRRKSNPQVSLEATGDAVGERA